MKAPLSAKVATAFTAAACCLCTCAVDAEELASASPDTAASRKDRFLRRGGRNNKRDGRHGIPAASPAGRNVIIKYKTEEGRYEAEGRGKKVGQGQRGRPHRLKKIKALAGYYTEQDIAELSARPDIEYIEDDAPVKRFCGSTASSSSTTAAGGADFGMSIRRRRSLSYIPQPIPYGINMTQADEVSARTNEGGEPIITVCIVDSGLDAAHEDIQQHNVQGASFGKKVGEWDQSSDSHGTHVAGTLAALGNNNCGVVGVESGGALNLLIARVFDDDGSDAKTSDLVAAIEWCADQGANIINMSLGNVDKVKAEGEAMAELYNEGILIVAAAGNFGDIYQKDNYPASFDEVISVGMVGEDMEVAVASQKNKQVELVAPGVSVLSTTNTGTGTLGSYIVNGSEYEGIPMEFGIPTTGVSPRGISGVLIDCGYAEEPCPSPVVSGQPHICLIRRGAPDPDVTITFVEKLKKCEKGGGIAAIVYNHLTEGPVSGTLSKEKHGVLIPAVGISLEQGLKLQSTQLNQEVTVVVRDDANYSYMTGTSMSTPHVAGIAAIIWSHHPSCSNREIRKVLQQTAQDQDDGGRDESYGFGIVRAKDALEYLNQNGCPDL